MAKSEKDEISNEYLDNLLKDITNRSGKLGNRMSHIDGKLERFIKERQIDLSEQKGEVDNTNRLRAQKGFSQNGGTKGKAAGTRDQIESRFKELKRTLYESRKHRRLRWLNSLFSPGTDWDMPQAFRQAVESGEDNLVDELNELRKGCRGVFKDLEAKTSQLSEQHKCVEDHAKFDQLAIMADFVLKKEKGIVGIDRLSDDIDSLERIVDEGIKVLEGFGNGEKSTENKEEREERADNSSESLSNEENEK